jgi:Peptidase family M28
MRSARLWTCLVCLAAGAFGQTAVERIRANIRAENLKADVAFLASDTLQGRATPSAGLEAAAEYIASQMRKAGLEAAGDDGYFQTATYQGVSPNPEGLAFSLGTVNSDGAIVIEVAVQLDLKNVPAFKTTPAELNSLTPDQVNGKVLIIDTGAAAGMSGAPVKFSRIMTVLQPQLAVIVRGAAPPASPKGPIVLDVDEPPLKTAVLTTWGNSLRQSVAVMQSGPVDARVSVHVAAPYTSVVKLRNVAGLLRGADPTLSDTFIVVTAHYDHVGVINVGEGDQIFNGANDDASGTSSVLEIGAALAAAGEKPSRSILFLALFGEELGFFGSRYYVGHPIVPLVKTVADLNLEVLGRTDDTERPTPHQINVTGYDYTDLAPTIERAGLVTGTKVVRHPVNSDRFFARGDNITFAEAGVPSASLSAAYEYPDLHKPTDKWSKLDYENMEQLDRCIALALWDLANNDKVPQWNRASSKTAPFVDAFDRLKR